MNSEKPAKQSRALPTVASFGADSMALLLRGAHIRTELGPIPWTEAVATRLRLHQLRKAMLHENHEKFPIVARAKIILTWGEAAGFPHTPDTLTSKRVRNPIDRKTPTLLTIEPHDSNLTKLARDRGIDLTALTEDPLDDLPVTKPPLDGGGDYLDHILKGKKLP